MHFIHLNHGSVHLAQRQRESIERTCQQVRNQKQQSGSEGIPRDRFPDSKTRKGTDRQNKGQRPYDRETDRWRQKDRKDT